MGGAGAVHAQSAVYAPVVVGAVPGQPYVAYETTDSLGRTIRFYISEAERDAPALPLVVYIQGSGTRSHFVREGERVVGQGGHNTVRDVVAGRARLLIVEKPGVDYLANPARSDGVGAGPVFRREHTLPRWTEAVHAAIRAALAVPGVDSTRILVAGHSEGGLVAARLAAEHERITHVALLAGGGPTQLYDLVELARRGTFFSRVSDDPAERMEYVYEQWAAIRRQPEAADSIWFGHSYARWASFLADAPVLELARTDAAIYLAQGTRDDAVTVESFDMLRAQLVALGRDVTARRVEGADHNFDTPGSTDGWAVQWSALIDWFLAPSQ